MSLFICGSRGTSARYIAIQIPVCWLLSGLYWGRKYSFPWVAWKWVINLRFVHLLQAEERKLITQFHATHGKEYFRPQYCIMKLLWPQLTFVEKEKTNLDIFNHADSIWSHTHNRLTFCSKWTYLTYLTVHSCEIIQNNSTPQLTCCTKVSRYISRDFGLYL